MRFLRWLAATEYRFPILLLVYFGLHVLVRGMLSSSLTFDEAEQVYLSQWWEIGYNGQPPLYTWVQTPLLEVIGRASIALPLVKNAFLFLTYLCVYSAVTRICQSRSAGMVASAAMLTMPQIAWESHRDLSHTVAAVFAASWLLLAIINVHQRPTMVNYVAIGLATAAGLLFKYNFAIVLVAFIAAALSIESFRRRLYDRRIIVSIVLAVICIGPHYWWAIHHWETASSKALTQLVPSEWMPMGERITTGLIRLVWSTLSCCAVTIVIFAIAFRDLGRVWWSQSRRSELAMYTIDEGRATELIERTIIGVTLLLVMLAVSGNAVETKNHWLQPYLFLLPIYLVLRLKRFVAMDEIGGARILTTAGVFGAVVLSVMVGRPISASMRGDYSWLNVPYSGLAERLELIPQRPAMIVATDVRTAGNLKAHLPAIPVVTVRDYRSRVSAKDETQHRVLLVVDRVNDGDADWPLYRMAEAMDRSIDQVVAVSTKIELPYRFGTGEDGHSFRVSDVRPLDGESEPADRIATSPDGR
ncbi:hypothetical protein Poly51_03420 [Rubripirellula tenax]|uniref:Glycosyltransferase RgtA/B/C/D-like domain-containing protein n=1 Tax=Rubripirellula tenax TaxID=2528015 RepID=A0A5C6FF78_9BACT|nr:glycosyltransferase family 39 protein [Rubripirellula tenax]TWU60068.1 hypothetical protein Poly51_03420 [Rubripirellula tenax]